MSQAGWNRSLAVKTKEYKIVPNVDEKLIEDKIGSSREEFADMIVDTIVDSDSQDLSVTDPELLKGTPYERAASSVRDDWSAHLGGRLI